MNRWALAVGMALAACAWPGSAVLAGSFVAATPYATSAQPVTIVLDASQASRGIMFAHEKIPVVPGPFTLVYPKWIPGEHGPTGPLNDLAALRISAGGTALDWRRDTIDLYAFHVNVPPGTHELDVDFDVLMNGSNGDTMSTRSLGVVNWNRVLLYQDGINSRQYFFKPSIVLPDGWEYGTALRDPQKTGNRVDFATTSLEMLVDSPLDMGRFVKKYTLWKDGAAFVAFDTFADAPQDLDIPEALLKAYERVPAEAFAMYGSRHFLDYTALLTLSDELGFQGIEHHQSSDDRADDDFLTDPDESLSGGDLVTHEFSHSWNGKYRRPDDLTTPNFQVPMQTDLLWVYEGMNQYLGDLLSFRAGIREPKQYPEYLATVYSEMDTETGRATTPLIDLTAGAPYYYLAGGQYHAIRRGAGDFYTEGELVWLDVDTIIRERSHGARSLDTFLHRFTEPSTTGPMVVTYDRAQVEELLNKVEAYDWHAFFDKYVYARSVHPPTDELERAGWKFVYTTKHNDFLDAENAESHGLQGWYSFGASVSGKGVVSDVRDGSPAWKAGFAPGMTILAVNGQGYTTSIFADALKKAEHTTAAISLIVKQTDWFQTIALDYHDGLKYPHLERIDGKPDMLLQIASPKAK
jgi:predicted metalloprotease with PDZ domain